MKLPLFQQARARTKSSPLDSSIDAAGSTKSPATILWIFLHFLCCLISLVLGFRFSRLVLFLLFSASSTTTPFHTAANIAETLTFTSSIINLTPPLINDTAAVTSSRVVVGRHGIRIRPWPHPNPIEVMKAHRLIETVQREQRALYGIKNPKTLIAITPTYVRTFQAFHLTGLMHTLMNLPYNVVWIVVEAGGATNETAALLAKSKLQIKHIGFEKKMPILWEDRHKMESHMRLEALRVVREQQLDGVVMFADDSNVHSLELFDEIQKVEWIGAVSIGFLAHSSHFNEDPTQVLKNSTQKGEKNSHLPIQGPSCNSSGYLTGWNMFDSLAQLQKGANYIGDMAVVLPRKLEWSGFVMNSRLVWKEAEFKPDWIKDWQMVFERDGDDDVESPLSLLKDTSMVEPLGSCGKKVMLWWLRAEARADSKFPAGWTIHPPLEVTVPVKRALWTELSFDSEKVIRRVQEYAEKHVTKTPMLRSTHSQLGKMKHEENADAKARKTSISGEK